MVVLIQQVFMRTGLVTIGVAIIIAAIVVGVVINDPYLGTQHNTRQESYRTQLGVAVNLLRNYHQNQNDTFSNFVATTPLHQLINFQVPTAEYQQIERQLAPLLAPGSSLDFVRIFDANFERLWFSTLDQDIVAIDDSAIQLVPISQVFETSSFDITTTSTIPLENPLYSQGDNTLVYRQSIISPEGEGVGVIFFYVNLRQVTHLLRSENIITTKESAQVTPNGILVNSPRFYADLAPLLTSVSDGARLTVNETENFIVLTENVADTHYVSLLVPESEISFSLFEYASYLFIIGISIVLLLFLLLHSRQGLSVMVEGKVLQFRTQLMRVIARQQLKDGALLQHLATQRDTLFQQIVTSIPAPSDSTHAKVNEIFNQEWVNLIAYLYHAGALSSPAQIIESDTQVAAMVSPSVFSPQAPQVSAPPVAPPPTPRDQIQAKTPSSGAGAAPSSGAQTLPSKAESLPLGLFKRAAALHNQTVEEVEGLYTISQEMYARAQSKSSPTTPNSATQDTAEKS